MKQGFGLIRMGKFNGNLKQALLKYSEKIDIFIPPNSGCIDYCIVTESNGDKCYIVVSERYLHFSNDKPNISIIIRSQNQEENKKRIKDLESVLGITLECPDPKVLDTYQKVYPGLIL